MHARIGHMSDGVRRNGLNLSMASLPVALTVLLALLVNGCGPGGGSSGGGSEDRLKAVATIGMIRDVAAEISGGLVEVEGLVGAGVDPHLYKPTAPDVKKLQSADLIFFNGLKLEGKMADVLEQMRRNGRMVRAISTELESRGNYLMKEGDGQLDPHIWMDVRGWMEAAKAIAAAMTELDPGNGAVYDTNLQNYLTQLNRLDEYCRKCIDSIPEDQRILVTAHDAFNYMARAYGLQVRGIQGISTESEAGVREIEDLVNYLVDKSIPAVFVESSVSDKNVKALVEGAGSRGHDVRIGGELFSDAMGPEGTYEGTYIGMIDHNVTTLTRALGGEAPEKGLNGRLGGAH